MSAGSRLLLAALLLSTLALGLFGIGRSLWLDEAWVANSILAPSLHDMFFYPDWLQTSPPGFLLLSRAVVMVAGLSNTSFRLLPLFFALIAASGMFLLSKRLLPLPWAVSACLLLIFHPAVVEYSHSTKQYSEEVAMAVLVLFATVRYFESPSSKRFRTLLLALVAGLLAAYPVAFLLPGVLFAVYLKDSRRALCLGIVCAGTLAGLWAVLIRPNTAPELRAFWRADSEALLTPGLIGALCSVVLLTIRAAIKPSESSRIQLLLASPCLLLALASLCHWYPANQRMRLWVLPCFILLCLSGVKDMLGEKFSQPAGVAAIGLALLFAAINVRGQIMEHRNQPEEEFSEAFQFLKTHVQPADLLMVHADASEGFKLYSAMYGWPGPAPLYGNTGWPCCARGKNAVPGSSDPALVTADVNALVPKGFSGTIWLFYSTRPSHWAYVGRNEGDLWRKLVWEKGCPPGPYTALKNLAVSPMVCTTAVSSTSTLIR